MPRAKLEPGHTTIDTVKVKKHDDGTISIQWRIRYDDGTDRIERHITRIKGNISDLRKQAHDTADRLLRTSADGAWSPASNMSDYVEHIIDEVKRIPDKDLRKNSRDSYVRVLRRYADTVRGYPIRSAVRPPNVKASLKSIANEHGTATAKQARKVVSKYVMAELVEDEVIAHNPILDIKNLRLPQYVARKKPQGGQAISPADHARVIDWLLTANPADFVTRRQGRYDPRLRWQAAIDVTLMQATTGTRISEVLKLTGESVSRNEEGYLTVTVTNGRSKSRRGRCIPIMDQRVAERVEARVSALKAPSAVVYPAPGSPDAIWNRSNAQKAVKRLYARIADELDIPLLRDVRTHVWRTTMNMEWEAAGIPIEVRAAYFGHSAGVNRRYYTDVTDISAITALLAK